MRYAFEDLLKEAYSPTVKSAWEEFFECLRIMIQEMEENKLK